MPLFYVLINSDVGADRIEKDIAKVVKKGTAYEFQRVYGVYDAVLKINDKGENARDLQDRVKQISKVQSTMILTVMADEEISSPDYYAS